jgi:hypothetical protein
MIQLQLSDLQFRETLGNLDPRPREMKRERESWRHKGFRKQERRNRGFPELP